MRKAFQNDKDFIKLESRASFKQERFKGRLNHKRIIKLKLFEVKGYIRITQEF